MKRVLSVVVAFTLALLTVGCTEQRAPEKEGVQIVLSDDAITVDGTPATHDETAAVYTANDIVFYLAGQDFTYGAGGEADAHTQTEADAHTVVHIAKPGIYRVSGTLSAGQIAVDLGEGAEEDESAVVTLVLDGADLTCNVAPAIIFYRVYECGSTDAEMASERVDTSAAGANIILADGSTNTINGSYVARIYKSYTLSADGTEVIDNKKLHKYDGALYSKMSMNVSGESDGSGILNINAENEGLDSELHLTVNSGNVNIVSGNDGINTNEDGISVTTINGGAVSICVSGATGEGDGIDSNGYLVINGGTVVVSACADSEDAGIDSDCGIYLNDLGKLNVDHASVSVIRPTTCGIYLEQEPELVGTEILFPRGGYWNGQQIVDPNGSATQSVVINPCNVFLGTIDSRWDVEGNWSNDILPNNYSKVHIAAPCVSDDNIQVREIVIDDSGSLNLVNDAVLTVDNIVNDDPAKHKKVTDELGIQYNQLIDNVDKNACGIYGINGIPHIMLIDKDGTILARNLRGDTIEAAVKEALAK